MEVGQLDNKKIGCIIQARMSSTRLPGKVLLPIPFPDGKPLLGLILDNLADVFKEEQIIVASSSDKENDVIQEYCEKRNIKCYRGSEHNVLSRFVALQNEFNFEHIFRFTADNPIIDIKILLEFLKWHIKESNDYSTSMGLPLGMNFEVFKGVALLESVKHADSDFDKEHVTPALKRENCFKKGYFKTEFDYTSKIRLTVDTVEDILLISTYRKLSLITNLSGMNLVNYTLSSYPWLNEINKQLIQKNSCSEEKDEIQNAISILRQLEYNKSAFYLSEKLSS
ncbi:MAG: cytidylyltransferase domain-containing protein [Chryseotalea sp.]|jgi:spore coat polysaccharide biosynthesis protein SpsF|nr:hypothetical protein [Flammeovirgaceae bacterium]